MNLWKLLRNKCGLHPSRKVLLAEIERLTFQYKDLSRMYTQSMRFNISCAYGFTEAMQCNHVLQIHEIIKNLIKELPPHDG